MQLDTDVERLGDVLALSELVEGAEAALRVKVKRTRSLAFSESMEAIMEEKLPITNE